MKTNRHGRTSVVYTGRVLIGCLYFRARCGSVFRTRHGIAYTALLVLALVACISVGVLVTRSTNDNELGRWFFTCWSFVSISFSFLVELSETSSDDGIEGGICKHGLRTNIGTHCSIILSMDLALKSGTYHSSSKPESVEHVYLYIRESRIGGIYRPLQRVRFPVARYAKLPLGTSFHVIVERSYVVWMYSP